MSIKGSHILLDNVQFFSQADSFVLFNPNANFTYTFPSVAIPAYSYSSIYSSHITTTAPTGNLTSVISQISVQNTGLSSYRFVLDGFHRTVVTIPGGSLFLYQIPLIGANGTILYVLSYAFNESASSYTTTAFTVDVKANLYLSPV